MSYMNSAELDLAERSVRRYVEAGDVQGMMDMLVRYTECAYAEGMKQAIEDVQGTPFLYGTKAAD